MRSEAGGPVQRLHPLSPLFSIAGAARRLLLPGLAVLLFASHRGARAELWLMLLFVPAVVGAVVRYFSFSLQLGHDELVIREGVVTRNERHIPYARIQNIDLRQNPVHRLLGVAEVRLETGAADEPEAVMRVVSLAAVEELRAHVSAGPLAAEPAAEGWSVLARLPHSELAIFGLISNQGLAAVLALIGAAWQAGLLQFEAEEQVADLLGRRFHLDRLLPHADSAVELGLTVAAALVALVVLLRLLSIGWALLKLHGFTLRRRGADLRAEFGLLTRVSATIPRHRIQLLAATEGWLHRLFRRAAVAAETAGGGGHDEATEVERQWLAPLVRRERLSGLLGEIHPEMDLSGA
ncbi:MAG TPA: PH domain-containing protein, partial [Candidatus Polarisedimenticolaceae bacterium]|nr:PH domain-containing protein [Candidatus Polarisedimenticolaceae bacterium]